MSVDTRRPIIQEIEACRQSKLVCYVTSIRPGVDARIADDAVREFIDHLGKFPSEKIPRLDVLIVSNGGDGVVPWRLMPIFREHSDFVSVLVPFKAYSAATIMALGANEIVMHRFAALGPIDPTVTNEFNPVESGTNRRIGISVEDVKAYVSFVKDTVGIRHEEELKDLVRALADKVHPLALGNVERFILQSRMIARKLLELHTDAKEQHKLDSIIEALASKLYFHGHPINRIEARQIGLNVVADVPARLEKAMWALYVDFEQEMEFRRTYDPMAELWSNAGASPTNVTPGAIRELARVEHDLTYARVETAMLSSALNVRLRHVLFGDGGAQSMISVTSLRQQWDQVPAP